MTEQEKLSRYFRECMGPSEAAVHIEDVDGFCYADVPSPHLPIVIIIRAEAVSKDGEVQAPKEP